MNGNIVMPYTKEYETLSGKINSLSTTLCAILDEDYTLDEREQYLSKKLRERVPLFGRYVDLSAFKDVEGRIDEQKKLISNIDGISSRLETERLPVIKELLKDRIHLVGNPRFEYVHDKVRLKNKYGYSQSFPFFKPSLTPFSDYSFVVHAVEILKPLYSKISVFMSGAELISSNQSGVVMFLPLFRDHKQLASSELYGLVQTSLLGFKQDKEKILGFICAHGLERYDAIFNS